MSIFELKEQPIANNGVLDISEWEPFSKQTIELKGEWDFYQNKLFDDYEQILIEDEKVQMVLPSPWNDYQQGAFGFGTYRLKVKVNPESVEQYAFLIPKIESAAEIYINGKLYEQIGKVGQNREFYEPSNVPRTIYYTNPGLKEIDLVIQVANFDHPSTGGIVAPIQFGYAVNIENYREFVTGMALLASAIYLLHALYAFILYKMGRKVGQDKRLLYFSLILLLIIFATLLTENILFLWFPIPYSLGIKLVNIGSICGGYLVYKFINQSEPNAFNRFWMKFYKIYSLAVFILILLLPVYVSDFVYYLGAISVLIPCIVALRVLYRSMVTIDRTNIFIFLGVIAAVYSFIWLIVIERQDIPFVSYPFDLIIAIILIAISFFSQFFRTLAQSQKMSEELQEVDKMKNRFLVSVAHEMKNPLNGILGISQAIVHREKNALDETTIKNLNIINSVGQRMSMMLNDLVELERLKHSNFSVSLRPIELRAITDSIIDMFQFILLDTNVTVINKIPQNFPLIFADENRVSQIIFNLVHNAVKFSENGEITIEGIIKDGWAKISVSDQGLGIDRELLEEIFQPYKQVSENTVYDSGIGLGLSICKQLVELHGGTIQAQSVQGEGSTFTFTLRLFTGDYFDEQNETLGQEEVSADSQLVESIATIKQPPLFDNNEIQQDVIKILAVDDDLVNLKVLESLFSSPRYKIRIVDNAKSALAILGEQDWDIVISDIMMPSMTGYEFTKEIREKYSMLELPVLLLTAYTKEESIQTGFLVGANDYVSKPLNSVELYARVNSLVRMKKSMEQRLHLEAAWLQAQIRPHFIINSFNSIAALGRLNLDRMDALIEELTKYIRLSIDAKNYEKTVSIERELELVKSYLAIQKERFGDRIQVIWSVDETLQFEVPPLSIQTLVENAISHGILKKPKGGEVKISIERIVEGYQIAICDNGVGMDADKCERLLMEGTKDTGIGIANTNRRLNQIFGMNLKIDSEVGKGTIVSYIAPIHESNSKKDSLY